MHQQSLYSNPGFAHPPLGYAPHNLVPPQGGHHGYNNKHNGGNDSKDWDKDRNRDNDKDRHHQSRDRDKDRHHQSRDHDRDHDRDYDKNRSDWKRSKR